MSKRNESSGNGSANNWSTGQAYGLALVCLILGLAVGYFLHGPAAKNGAPVSSASQSNPAQDPNLNAEVTPEQLKHMADTQAKPLLAELERSPKDASRLTKVANLYYDAQQYQDAIRYYKQVLEIQPLNADVRTDMGTSYWYLGDADTAIGEFQKSLQANPTHPGTLLNLGVVKWQGKMDVSGAIAAWQKLLDTNPNYPDRAKVEQLIGRARQHANIKPGTKTNKPATM